MLAPATSSFRQGHDSLLSVIPTAEGNTSAGTATVTRLRAALASVPGRVEVGGNTAQNVDFNSAVYGNFPLMLAVIAIVTFLILARAFRSVVLAAKAVLVNLVSLGATFGFLVLFWQNGHGSNLLYGVPATGSIRNWIPIISFAFLFGISMDYEVFILARTREEYDRTGSTNQADRRLARAHRTARDLRRPDPRDLVRVAEHRPDIVVEMIATALAFGVLIDARDRPHAPRPRARRDHGPLELVDARRLRAPATTPTTHQSRRAGRRVTPVPTKSPTLAAL